MQILSLTHLSCFLRSGLRLLYICMACFATFHVISTMFLLYDKSQLRQPCSWVKVSKRVLTHSLQVITSPHDRELGEHVCHKESGQPMIGHNSPNPYNSWYHTQLLQATYNFPTQNRKQLIFLLKNNLTYSELEYSTFYYEVWCRDI